MILYCDTSALVKLYVEEAGSSWVRRWVDASQVVGIAAIGYVEAKAAFARAVHSGRVIRRMYRRMVKDFEEDWSRYLVMELSRPVIRHAGRLAEVHRLRASDAVHLAAALQIRAHASEEVTFLGFDDELNRAAKAERLMLAPPPSYLAAMLVHVAIVSDQLLPAVIPCPVRGRSG